MKALLGLLVIPIPMACAMITLMAGCKEDRATPEPPGAVESTQTPVEGVVKAPVETVAPALESTPKKESAKGETTPPADGGEKLSLTGATMTIPKGWTSQAVPTGMMAPVAVFHLPKAEDDSSDAVVRITHFPAMKGMDDRNIERWLSQVKHPDGRAMTRDDAEISTTQNGSVRLTVVDISGMVNQRSDGRGTEAPDQRMIAAIVDHPKGPHFVKISGGVATMKRWEEAIDAFLNSAAAN